MKEIEVEYFKKLITEYKNSDFYSGKNLNVKKILKNPDAESIDRLNNLKNFKDFLIQKQKDMTFIYLYLLSMENDYEYVFGRILELNSGYEESLALIDNNESFNIELASKYADVDLFGEQDFPYYKADLQCLSSIEKDNVIRKFVLILRALSDYKNKEQIKKHYKNIKDYNTILNINPEDPETIIKSYLYSYNTKIFSIAGYVSNLYDKNLNEKEQIFRNIIAILNNRFEIEPQVLTIESEGTEIRTLTNL